MDTRRLRFVAAFLVLLAWIASLSAMAIHSARRPADRDTVILPP